MGRERESVHRTGRGRRRRREKKPRSRPEPIARVRGFTDRATRCPKTVKISTMAEEPGPPHHEGYMWPEV